MHPSLSALLLAGSQMLASASDIAHAADEVPGEALVGRWDIRIESPLGDQPSWLEVRRSGFRALVGQFVGVVGSARPVSRIAFDAGALRFSIPAQWEAGDGEMAFEGKLDGDTLSGTMRFPDGTHAKWQAGRAPMLQRDGTPQWGEPVKLFDGRGLDGWKALGGVSKWTVPDGELRNAGGGANLATTRTFTDFKLHVELRLPRGSNSGVYLRGRHEVQIADEGGGVSLDSLGAVYGFLAPSEDASKGPDAWQSLDITLLGRRVSVAVNGRQVIVDREIPGITGGALDSDEGAPGPIVLQGDHGAVAFRNLVLTPAR